MKHIYSAPKRPDNPTAESPFSPKGTHKMAMEALIESIREKIHRLHETNVQNQSTGRSDWPARSKPLIPHEYLEYH